MATSGSVDFNLNAREICTYALRKLRIIGADEAGDAAQIATAREELNLMLKGWQRRGPNLFRQTFASQTITDATSNYTLSTNPHRVLEVRFRYSDGRDLPMTEMTRQDYVDLPQKTSAGTPTQYYVDYQRTGAVIYVWPVLATAAGETLEYTYQRRYEDVDALNNDIDIPQDWLDVVGYNLADRLQDQFGVDDKRITARAVQLYAEASDDDREEFVRFMPEFI